MPNPPKDHDLKVISGTVEKSREAKTEADAPEFDRVKVFPPAPQHLDVDGAQLWKELGTQLVACGVLQVVDLYALEQLCYCWQRFRQKAKAKLEITASEDNALKALWAEFGLTPAARRRVVANLTEPPAANRFAGHGKR